MNGQIDYPKNCECGYFTAFNLIYLINFPASLSRSVSVLNVQMQLAVVITAFNYPLTYHKVRNARYAQPF